MNDITLLDSFQTFENRLDLLKEIGIQAKPTDFALLQGANMKNGYGEYYTKTSDENGSVIIVNGLFKNVAISFDNDVCVRPVIKYSSIKEEIKKEKYINDGIIEIEYGEYPQTIDSLSKQKQLEELFKQYMLVKTGGKWDDSITGKKNNEYLFNSIRYIRMSTRYINKNVIDNLKASNKIIDNQQYAWVRVEPVKYLVDLKNDIAICKDLLFVDGLYNKPTFYDGDFLKTDLSKYLNNIFKTNTLQHEPLKTTNNTSIVNVDSKKINIYDKKTNINDKIKIKNGVVILNENTYKINPENGKDEEIKELEKNILIPKKGVVLVGEPGVGKTSIVEGLVYKIQNNLVCNALKNKIIMSVNVSDLLSGTSYRGEFEKKLTDLCNYISDNPNIILFIDEMHNSIGAGRSDGQKIDMANILKPYISNKNLKVIGCTTREEFQNFSNDSAYRRRFNILDVQQLDYRYVKQILKEYIHNNEFNIKVDLSEYKIDYLCDLIIKLSKRKVKYVYASNNNPDASINILMYCFAYFAVTNIENPTLNDFIDGIKDNKNLSITEFDSFTQEENSNSKYEENRKKIILHTN